MKPSLGRIVIYRQPDEEAPVNGAREHPAIVCRVWSNTCVNLRVFADTADPPQHRPSVELLGAEEHPDQPNRWRWPERSEVEKTVEQGFVSLGSAT